jgi:hypothetical protein
MLKEKTKMRSKKLGEQSVFRQMILAIIVQNAISGNRYSELHSAALSTKQNERLN